MLSVTMLEWRAGRSHGDIVPLVTQVARIIAPRKLNVVMIAGVVNAKGKREIKRGHYVGGARNPQANEISACD